MIPIHRINVGDRVVYGGNVLEVTRIYPPDTGPAPDGLRLKNSDRMWRLALERHGHDTVLWYEPDAQLHVTKQPTGPYRVD